MTTLHGKDFGYPLLALAEAFVYREAFAVDWESHAFWEFHHVLSGTVDYEIAGRRTIGLHGGMFLAIPPRLRHRTRNGAATPSTRLALRWAPGKSGGAHGIAPLSLSHRELGRIFAHFADEDVRPHVMTGAMVRSARELFHTLERVQGHPHGLEAAILRHRCNDMLINLAIAGTEPEPMPKDTNVVARLQSHIESHLTEKLTMRDLTQVSGYGSTQLTKIFQQEAGMTPRGYIVRARLRQARRLLTETRLPLSEIAKRCGFPSDAYFSSVFRKYENRTPGSLRG